MTDPWQGISSCIRYALKRMGLPNVSDAVLRDAIDPPLRMSFKSLLQAHRQAVSDADIEIAVEFYRKRYAALGLYENER